MTFNIEIETGITDQDSRRTFHDRRCQAAAMIAAVENARDAEASYDDWLYQARTEIFPTAIGYIADGLMSCNCADDTKADRERGSK